jgi:hypothetical protein
MCGLFWHVDISGRLEPIMLTLRISPSELATVYCGKGTVAKLNKEHSSELSDLSTQQTKALTDATYLGMTAEQWSEYDNRHVRILEILRDGQAELKVP